MCEASSENQGRQLLREGWRWSGEGGQVWWRGSRSGSLSELQVQEVGAPQMGGTQRGLWGSRNEHACRRGVRRERSAWQPLELVVRTSSVAWRPSTCLKQPSDALQFIFY